MEMTRLCRTKKPGCLTASVAEFFLAICCERDVPTKIDKIKEFEKMMQVNSTQIIYNLTIDNLPILEADK
jgi:hypothetical protein